MANKIILEFAQSRGLPMEGDTVITEENGYLISYGVIQSGNATVYAASVSIAEESWEKDKLKELRQSFKKVAGVGYAKAQKLLQFTVGGMGKKTILEKFGQVAAMVVGELERLNIAPAAVCKYCGMPDTDDIVVEGSVALRAHRRCKEEQADKILQQIEHNETTGSTFMGVIGAIIGGIVGSLPNPIMMSMGMDGEYWLYALIPPCAYLFYKLFRGVMSKAVPIIVSVVALACTVVQEFILSYLLFSSYLSDFGCSFSRQLQKFFAIVAKNQIAAAV